MDLEENDILDELQDAREAHEHEKRILGLFIFVAVTNAVVSIAYSVFLSVLHSLGENWGNYSGWPIIVTATASVAFTIMSFAFFFDGPIEDTKKDLKRVERRYRNYLNRKAAE